MSSIIPGAGVYPSAGAILNELTDMTRRIYIPRTVVQIYNSGPTLMLLLGGAHEAAGGIGQITPTIQGNSMVAGGWTGYSGTFAKPTITPGLQNATFNLSYYVVPVPLVMGETLLQSTGAVVPIIDARMNDVSAVTNQQMSSAVFTNNTANPQMPNSFVDAFDNGAIAPNYGGINRLSSANVFWQGQVVNAGAANILSRATMAQYLIQATDNAGGESPTFACLSPSDFAGLNSSFIGVETMNLFPGRSYSDDTTVRSSFPNLIISGVPFFLDHWCPKGTLYFVNSKYTSMYLSADAKFAFSGFYSAIPQMQIAEVGAMIVGYNIVCTKPNANTVVTNFTGGAW